MSDGIYRRNDGKQGRRRGGGRSTQLPDWVMNKIKRKHIITALTWVTIMKSHDRGESLNVVKNSIFLLFRILAPCIY